VAGCDGPAADEMENEICKDGEIQYEESNSEPRDAMEELEDLQREEGCCDDGGEIFRPDFLKHEADAFENSEECVAEEEEADLAEAMVVEELRFLEDDADKAAFGVHSQAEGEMGEELVEVAAHQAKDADSNADEKRRLQQLVNGNQLQPAVPLFAISGRGHLRFAPQ
jgi:hypothetical protein